MTIDWNSPDPLGDAVKKILLAELAGGVYDTAIDQSEGSHVCPECNFIGNDEVETTEHVFAKHPEAVAR